MHCPFTHATPSLPGHVEAALQFLRLAEEIRQPRGFDTTMRKGRELSQTEAEVHDSALTVLLDYFNQPITPAIDQPDVRANTPGDESDDDEIPF